MRSKLALTAVLAAVMLVAVPNAYAKTSKLLVKGEVGTTDECRIVPGQLRISWIFKAKITRRNSPLPKRVKITYSTVDSSSGAPVASGALTLTKRNKWTAISDALTFNTGGTYDSKFTLSYKAPISHKTVHSNYDLPLTINTDAELDQQNPPLPACV